MRELGVDTRSPIWADSAEPKSIEEIYRRGYNIKPVEKGPDSIRQGIDVVKRYPLHITTDSPNTLKEIKNYKWLIDKNGIQLPKPQDKNNHALDAMRYAISMELKEANSGKYNII